VKLYHVRSVPSNRRGTMAKVNRVSARVRLRLCLIISAITVANDLLRLE